MVTDFEIQEILDRLVDRILDVLDIDAAGVTLISSGKKPRYVAASNDAALRYEQLQTTVGDGPCLLAWHSGKVVSVPDLALDDRFPRFAPQAREAGLVAVFALPLNHGDHPLGALDLYRSTPGALSEEALEAAQTLADVAAAYLINAQAREDLLDSSAVSLAASLHDALTGLPNRVLLLDRIGHAFERSRRSGTASAVFFLDLDRFKAVNDMYGHHAGDQLLVAAAARMASVVRPGDTLARLAGDEFVILCEGLHRPQEAMELATRLDVALKQPFEVAGTDLKISASIGVAFTDLDNRDPEQALHDADSAMYQAKHHGGARPRLFDPNDQPGPGLERDLRGAIARGELRTMYQPVVTANDGQVTGFEALLRWDHPTRGLIPPNVTIPLAERSGMIVEIGQWVLERAWTARNRWHRMLGGAELTMAVNVSAHQLMSGDYTEALASVIRPAGVDLGSLTLEVTESVFVSDSARALIVLNDLKRFGISLALDDFGTGYSSLSYLREFPLDILKVDKAFIAGLGIDSTSELIVHAVIELAHGLGMTVIAEGVETAEQRHHVNTLGCDACQGYYFARPMTDDAIDDVIARRTRRDTPLKLPA